ncbi:MAG: Rrf2 family transcriptional regulator [Acidobacteria bacterium]|nr:Rrf2 family transcriptional regulator [Acidobacteriota bacterium]
MHLTLHSDYALRVLLYLRLRGENKSTIQEIADAYAISKNHLMKVVQQLAALGYVSASRGRNGGLVLAKQAEDVNLGRVVEQMEPHLNLVECFDMTVNTCPIALCCDLKTVLTEAQQSFLTTLARYTLADLGTRPERLRKLLQIAPASQPGQT